MKMPANHTKFKVVTGYILLFILTVSVVFFIYNEINKLGDDKYLVSSANRKLFLISNTITGLYEAESLSNSFLQTGSNESFQKYIRIIHNVENNIDSLKGITPEIGQQLRIDTIQTLLNDKISNLKDLINVKKKQVGGNYYNKVISLIKNAQDPANRKPDIRKRELITVDSNYTQEKKRKGILGWFSRKPDSLLNVRISNHTVWDTIQPKPVVGGTDSIISILESERENYRTETENISQQISLKEYDIVLQSVLITEQLKKVLYDYEQEEINHSISRAEQREQVINSTTNLLSKIAIAAVVLIAFFCTLILRDISRNQRYRNDLETAKNYADQLLKSREKLILTVTHDIKSPLGSIIGYIELLHNTAVTSKQEYYLKNMKGSSEHILNLVTKLLDFSRLDSNQIKPEEVNYNPGQLLREVGENFIPQAQDKGLELIILIDQALNEEYSGDALRIRQIVMNILSNAVKYTREGNISLNANISDNMLIIKVKDTGQGISQKEQSIIFNEFTRLSPEVNKDIEGTGLGLAITQKLTALLGGEIRLESETGKGSCFTVSLPLKQASLSRSQETHKNLNILIVDDDRLQLEMSAALLKNQGITGDTTTSATEAINKLAGGHYDMVFSDIQMPEVDGFTFVRQIRESGFPFAKEIPVIALSARADLNETTFKEAGFSAYLNKPFSASQLFELIGKFTNVSAFEVKGKKEDIVKSEIYTLKNIMEFTDHDPEATGHIIRSFINDTEQHIELLRSYREQEQVRKLVHKMLPMFRQLEVTGIIGPLQKLERSAEILLPEDEFKMLIQKVIDDAKELVKTLSETGIVNQSNNV